jgi:5-methylcytosine-specific restriction protein A
MPYAIEAGCTQPGCPERAVRRGRCEKHQRQRRNFDDPFYRTPYWRQVRAEQLAREPNCRRHAKRGEVVPATDVHHIVARKSGGDESPGNLESLCASCHSGETFRGR